MGQIINKLLDKLSEYLAPRKGLIPLIGIVLVLINFVIQFIPAAAGLAQINLFLHLGLVVALIGVMLAWAL